MIRTGARDSYIITRMQLIMVNLSGRSDARIKMTFFFLIRILLLICAFHRLQLKIIIEADHLNTPSDCCGSFDA